MELALSQSLGRSTDDADYSVLYERGAVLSARITAASLYTQFQSGCP
jgi:hypothetical protein